MGRATWIVNDISGDREFRKLPRDGQRMYFELLANAFGNIAGYFAVDLDFEAMVAHASADEVEEWLMIKTPLWKYDPKTSQVLLPTYLKYNKVKAAKQLQGVATEISKLKVCPLHIDFIDSLERYAGTGASGFIDTPILKDVRKLIESKVPLDAKDEEVLKIIRAYI